jgi:hypothetical protein
VKRYVVTAYSDHTNIGGDQPIAVIYFNPNTVRYEHGYIQPEDCTPELQMLGKISEAFNKAMIKAVEKWERQSSIGKKEEKVLLYYVGQ